MEGLQRRSLVRFVRQQLKKMQKDIDLYEYEWWPSFIGYIISLLIALGLLYVWFSWYPLVDARNYWQLSPFLFIPIIIFISRLPNFTYIIFVPKLLAFKEDSIVVVQQFKCEKIFRYNNIVRIVIYNAPKWNEPWLWLTTSFRVQLYFSDNTKVVFDPNYLSDYPGTLSFLKKKGLGNLIEQK